MPADLLGVVGLALLIIALYVIAGPVRRVVGPSLYEAFERYRERRAANSRAEALLRHVLSPGEYRQLRSRGYLDVPSPGFPGRVYRIPRRRGWIVVYEANRAVFGLCVAPAESLPSADVFVAHRLMIQGDEPEYLRRANRVSLAAFLRLGLNVVGERHLD